VIDSVKQTSRNFMTTGIRYSVRSYPQKKRIQDSSQVKKLIQSESLLNFTSDL
jgi:hypothetical protein